MPRLLVVTPTVVRGEPLHLTIAEAAWSPCEGSATDVGQRFAPTQSGGRLQSSRAPPPQEPSILHGGMPTRFTVCGRSPEEPQAEIKGPSHSFLTAALQGSPSVPNDTGFGPALHPLYRLRSVGCETLSGNLWALQHALQHPLHPVPGALYHALQGVGRNLAGPFGQATRVAE
eukprot:CAMPEP_0196654482 /NCGR_PEP_ID=MMETSP1086-20130531/4206_1 /TAXON_ID=77921 /ORGANISM="Cyanoptyche  gloeocystis , Strain SAG4.97" /LENGTH=172 /DNA_ID=CAMNT_0041986285 /DNA_START=173 /DNA_END=690 /DNA_ORIENTATION=-